jgi:hypothetical protein
MDILHIIGMEMMADMVASFSYMFPDWRPCCNDGGFHFLLLPVGLRGIPRWQRRVSRFTLFVSIVLSGVFKRYSGAGTLVPDLFFWTLPHCS